MGRPLSIVIPEKWIRDALGIRGLTTGKLRAHVQGIIIKKFSNFQKNYRR
jgi:hypothetical protein